MVEIIGENIQLQQRHLIAHVRIISAIMAISFNTKLCVSI